MASNGKTEKRLDPDEIARLRSAAEHFRSRREEADHLAAQAIVEEWYGLPMGALDEQFASSRHTKGDKKSQRPQRPA